jgi:hypothetical protein
MSRVAQRPAIPPHPTAVPCPADDELTELLALLLERAHRRRHRPALVVAMEGEAGIKSLGLRLTGPRGRVLHTGASPVQR